METTRCPVKSDLLSELECPVCMEYLMPPIVFCLNGHNVCPRCRPKLKVCPNCRQPFVNIRNIALEKMSRQIEYPCIYRRSGCMQRVTFDLKQEHEKMCAFNKHNCPLSKIPAVRCTWIGSLENLKKHLIDGHEEWTHNYRGNFMTGLVDIKPSRRYCYIIFALDQVFYRYFSVKDGILYGVLMYVGPTENADKYRYRVTFKNNTESICISHQTRSISENLEDVRKSGKCIKLHFDAIKNFINTKNNLKFQMEISRADETRF